MTSGDLEVHAPCDNAIALYRFHQCSILGLGSTRQFTRVSFDGSWNSRHSIISSTRQRDASS